MNKRQFLTVFRSNRWTTIDWRLGGLTVLVRSSMRIKIISWSCTCDTNCCCCFLCDRFVAGVISQERLVSFERMLWRACRGNVFMRQTPIEEPLEDKSTVSLPNKHSFAFPSALLIFSSFCSREHWFSRWCLSSFSKAMPSGHVLKRSVRGELWQTLLRPFVTLWFHLHSFRATLYQCPETVSKRQEMCAAVANRISDIQTVLHTTVEHSVTQLEGIAQEIAVWQQKVLVLSC